MVPRRRIDMGLRSTRELTEGAREMADMECDFCDEENAITIITNLVTGDVWKIGPACWPDFILNMAQALMEGMGAEQLPDDETATEPTEPTGDKAGTDTPPDGENASDVPTEPDGHGLDESSGQLTATGAPPPENNGTRARTPATK